MALWSSDNVVVEVGVSSAGFVSTCVSAVPVSAAAMECDRGK